MLFGALTKWWCRHHRKTKMNSNSGCDGRTTYFSAAQSTRMTTSIFINTSAYTKVHFGDCMTWFAQTSMVIRVGTFDPFVHVFLFCSYFNIQYIFSVHVSSRQNRNCSPFCVSWRAVTSSKRQAITLALPKQQCAKYCLRYATPFSSIWTPLCECRDPHKSALQRRSHLRTLPISHSASEP